MNKRPGLIAEGSSVDDDPEGNQFEDDPTSDQLKRNKLSEDAASHSEDHPMGSEEEAGSSVQTANSNQDGTQRTSPEQDAASHSEDHPMGSEEEAGSSVQMANSNQDGTQRTSPEQMRISDDPEKQKNFLQQLQDVMSDVSTYPADAELLVPCFRGSGISPEKLLHSYQKYRRDLQEKYGSKNSDRPVFSSNKAKISSSSAHGLFTATVKVFSVVTGQTCGAHVAILENASKSTAVEIASNQQDCDIIMIFCPIASRVGSDVQAAMRDIPADKPAVLVLMHHTRDADYSTDTKRWKEDYRNIKLEVHVLFHETQQGLLKCKKNDQAADQIQEVLKSYSKRKFRRWSPLQRFEIPAIRATTEQLL